jgi:hypothetical protein
MKDKLALLNNKFSDIGWECRAECAKAIRYQTCDIRDAWLEVTEISDDSQVKSEAQFQKFEFLVATVVWYDIMFAVYTLSNTIRSTEMQTDEALTPKGLVNFRLKKYRKDLPTQRPQI